MSKRGSQLQQRMFSLVAECRNNRRNRTAFCKEHKISIHQYMYWQEKYLQSGMESNKQKFLPVKTDPAGACIQSNINLYYPNGIRLELPAGTNISYIRSLIG